MAVAIPSTAVRCFFTAGDPKLSVDVQATHPLVVSTPFLSWDPAAPDQLGRAMAGIATWKAVRAFGRRLSASKSPADLSASRRVHPLLLGLSAAAWTRVLDEYISSGLLSRPLRTLGDLDEALSSHRSGCHWPSSGRQRA